MNTDGMIEITGCNIRNLVKAAYDLSRPQGLGFIHAKQGALSEAEIDELLDLGDDQIAVSMDYVHGRACKMTVFKDEEGRMWIDSRWYDHSEQQLQKLLERCGV